MQNNHNNACANSDQVKELKRQIMNLQAQLEIERARNAGLAGGNLLASEPIDYYPGEQLDFILSILRQAQKKCAPDSRPYDIIESILSMNQPIGRGEEILDELNRVFKKGDIQKPECTKALQDIGFRYISSKKHPKLRFQDKYQFVLPATASDWRSAKNALSEINKCIAVSQKI